MVNFGIVELYCGAAGKKGFYNNQEVGLARAMKKIGYNCFIFYPAPNEIKRIEEEVEENILIIHCPAKQIGVHGKYDWRVLSDYQIKTAQIGADNQLYAPDVIRYCDKHGILAYIYTGTTETNTHNPLKRHAMNLLYRRNLAAYRSHKVFAKTTHVKKQLMQYGVLEVEVAPVGLDTTIIPTIRKTKEEIRAICELPQDKKILLFVGRLENEKCPLKMLSIISGLSDDYYGIMIGDGTLSDLIEKGIEKLRLGSRMTWIKGLPNEEVHKYYVAADYYLNFPDKEIFGMGILEAMYQGCTVIAMHAPGPDMIICNKKTGYLVDDEDEMRALVVHASPLDASLIQKDVCERFSWEGTAALFDKRISKKQLPYKYKL